MEKSAITESYEKYFSVVRADTTKLREAAYSVRYQVYCLEFDYERPEDYPEGLETDEYDDQSLHCVLFHNPSGMAAGCVRLVMPNKDDLTALLPFERCCAHALDQLKLDISRLDRSTLGEISRLAVLASFRRRKTDERKPISVPDRNSLATSGRDTFPLIPMSLCLGMTSMLLNSGLDYGFAMMEPRLTRMLRRFGIYFKQIGNVVDYHGFRGPFLIERKDILSNLRSDVFGLFKIIDRQLFPGT
jgi:N-acyl amino acid synthase of PEP-CTERM/exosortase system